MTVHPDADVTDFGIRGMLQKPSGMPVHRYARIRLTVAGWECDKF